jgi:UDP-2,3-diacylglucosamine pyrophosphatase LpxH
MESLSRFDELYVLSDLHMGGDPKMQIFEEGDLLARVIKALGASTGTRRIALCINGDMVDFLADDAAKCFDPGGAKEKLRTIVCNGLHEGVWRALREFVKHKHHTLVITLGNHDLELALPWVREELLEHLTGGDQARRGRIRLAFDGGGFACQVGKANVLCVHGNDIDHWNFTDYERVRRIGRDHLAGLRVEEWVPNAGSQLVVTVMNTLKRKYPFIDLLKPEVEAVVPILVTLAREHPEFDTIAEKIANALAIASRVAWDKTRRAWGWLSAHDEDADELQLQQQGTQRLDALMRRLEPDAAAHPPGAGMGDLWQVNVEQWLRSDKTPLQVLGGEDAQQLGRVKNFFRRVFGRDPVESLRRSLTDLTKDQSFDLLTPDDTSRQMDALVSPQMHFLVTGHTHLQRALRRGTSNSYYYNSGTWVHLMQLRPDTLQSQTHFREVYEAIRSGDREALKKPTGLMLRLPAVVRIAVKSGRVLGELLRANTRKKGDLLAPIDNTQFAVE